MSKSEARYPGQNYVSQRSISNEMHPEDMFGGKHFAAEQLKKENDEKFAPEGIGFPGSVFPQMDVNASLKRKTRRR